MVSLYAQRHWGYDDDCRQTGYSIPLSAEYGPTFRHPTQILQNEIRALPHVMSFQITFHEGVDPSLHPMPPGGFRLAVINSTNLAAGMAARRLLASALPPELILHQGEPEMSNT